MKRAMELALAASVLAGCVGLPSGGNGPATGSDPPAALGRLAEKASDADRDVSKFIWRPKYDIPPTVCAGVRCDDRLKWAVLNEMGFWRAIKGDDPSKGEDWNWLAEAFRWAYGNGAPVRGTLMFQVRTKEKGNPVPLWIYDPPVISFDPLRFRVQDLLGETTYACTSVNFWERLWSRYYFVPEWDGCTTEYDEWVDPPTSRHYWWNNNAVRAWRSDIQSNFYAVYQYFGWNYLIGAWYSTLEYPE